MSPRPREVGDVFHFFAENFVQDDADDFYALLFKQSLVQANFINRFADAALRDDDDLRAENFGDLRIGKIENGTNARVAAAFAQHKIFFPRNAVKGFLDFADERLVVGRLKIFAREIRLDGDGAHVHERRVQAIHGIHQHGIFVNFLLLDLDEALADRLDVTNAGKMFLQRGDETERRSGLAIVLPRGGDENAGSGRVHLITGQLRVRARIKFLIIRGLHADDRGHAQDIVGGGTARTVSGRAVQAKQNLTIGVSATDSLHELAGDVAGIKIGKNQHVRAARRPGCHATCARRLPG